MAQGSDRWWAAVDRSTRLWWRAWGRRADGLRWLDGPVGTRGGGEGWMAELERVGRTSEGSVGPSGAGLLPDLAALDGPSFDATTVHPDVRHFYEHTADWRMDVWIGWSAAFAPFGALIDKLFGRRVQQLAIPVSPLDSARGLDSRIVTIADDTGAQAATAWLRTLRATGGYLYSGRYTTARLPRSEQPVVHVTFPLEAGNVQVFLRPSVDPDGSLWLISPPGDFGDPGAYVVVDEPAGRYAARLPIHESFHVYPADDRSDEVGVLRTDHDLRLWRAPVLRLHYRMRRS